MKLSIVVPCYNEEKNVSLFYEEFTKVFKKFKDEYEFIFVNDGSKDNTFLELKQIDNIELNLSGEINGTNKIEGDSINRE